MKDIIIISLHVHVSVVLKIKFGSHRTLFNILTLVVPGNIRPPIKLCKVFVAIHSYIPVTKFGRNPIKYDMEEKADCLIFATTKLCKFDYCDNSMCANYFNLSR